jgi:hypothetical protein
MTVVKDEPLVWVRPLNDWFNIEKDNYRYMNGFDMGINITNTFSIGFDASLGVTQKPEKWFGVDINASKYGSWINLHVEVTLFKVEIAVDLYSAWDS